MDKTESQVMPVPPNLITAFRAGFDAVANKIVIIIIPIIFDLMLWLGPHLQIKSILSKYIDNLASTNNIALQTGDIVSAMLDSLRALASQFNLLSLLRTFPVGIPSLMATRSPISIPLGSPVSIDITNPIAIAMSVVGILTIGIFLGCFYFLLVAQVSLASRIEIQKIIHNWFQTTVQVIGLALALFILLVVVSIPSMCIISALTLIGLPIGQFAVLIYLGIILWLAYPLLFSAHGIFVNHNNAFLSVQRSVAMTRMTLSTTTLFIFCIIVISVGLDILWRIPPEKSWLTLIGVSGHAFVASGLLAASFIYYRDADQWTQRIMLLMKSNRSVEVKGG